MFSLNKTNSHSFVKLIQSGLAEKLAVDTFLVFPVGFSEVGSSVESAIQSVMHLDSLVSFVVVLPLPKLRYSDRFRLELTFSGQQSGLLMTPITFSSVLGSEVPQRLAVSVFSTMKMIISVEDRYFRFISV